MGSWQFLFNQSPDYRSEHVSTVADEVEGMILDVTTYQHWMLAEASLPANVVAIGPLADLREMRRAIGSRCRYAEVQPGDEAAGRMAAEHLRGLGLSTLAYVGPRERAGDHSELRYRGFVAGAAGLRPLLLPGEGEPDAVLNAGPSPRQAAVREAWISALPKPVGILAWNSGEARHLLAACRRTGVRVPEDAAVTGVDHDPLEADIARPPLSVVDLDETRVGYEAARLLDRLMRGEDPPSEPMLVPPRGLIERQSTDVVAVEDPDIAAAVRFIRDQALDGIRVADVLRHVPMSRRTLERGFERLLGRTVHDEIQRIQLDEARRLLRDTDLAMPELTERCGFSYPTQFARVFRRVVGVSPREYRAQTRTEADRLASDGIE